MVITLTPPQNITHILCGTSTPKLGGVIDVSDFTNLQLLYCTDNDLTEVNGYADNPNMVNFRISGNKLSTPLPSLIGMSNMETFYCNGNQITGQFPNITGLSNLDIINFGNNQMSGTLPPDFGTLGLTSLKRLNIFTNNFSGAIPSFSGMTTLQWVLCENNNFTDFTGEVPISLYNFKANDNNLTQTAIDNILQAFVDANRITGMSSATINLAGSGNAPPSAAGEANVTILRNRGWEVSTN